MEIYARRSIRHCLDYEILFDFMEQVCYNLDEV